MIVRNLRLLGLGLVFLATCALASEKIESGDFALATQKAAELAVKYKTSRVLVVYDIDNTLLAMDQDLGSDQWFNWQASKIATGDLQDAVASDFSGLLSAQGKLYALSHMHTPEESTSALVAELQNQGFSTVVFTSRGSDLRDSTMRELKRSGFDFSKTSIGPKLGYAGTYLPYQLESISDYGLSQEEIAKFKLGNPRPVSFMDGVFMGSGQHKGVMLRTLLWKAKKVKKRAYKAILFVDDGPKNADAIQAAFENEGVDVVTIRYNREDDKVKRFQENDKTDVIQKWNDLHGVLTSVFGN